jgi:microcystin-dependent protein
MAADAYSTLLGLLLMGTGNDNNSWGANANNSIFQIMEDAVAGTLASSVTGGTLDLSTPAPPSAASLARYAVMSFSGALTSDQIVKVPNLSKLWIVDNATSGAFTLTFKTPSGTASAAIPPGYALVSCDGANTISVGLSTSLRDVQWLGADGTVAAPGVSFASEPGTGIYRKSAGVVGISIGGVEILEVSATAVNVVGASTSLQVAGAQVIPPGIEDDYDGIELPAGGWLWCDGGAYSRPVANGGTVDTYKNLFNALTKAATATVASGSNTLSSLSADLTAKGLKGAYIEGAGIPTGTKINAITATTITMSANATGNGTAVAIRILPWGQGDASTTFNVPDRKGRTIFGRDDMNGTAAGRLVVHDGTQLSLVGGEEQHTLTKAEAPTGLHTLNFHDPTHAHPSSTPNTIQGVGGDTTTGYAYQWGALGYSGYASTGITASLTDNAGSGAHENMPPFGIANKIIKT